MSHGDIHRRTGALLLLATLLIGIAWILVLPPFEGFDETMHYSSLREVADRQTLPAYGESRIAAVVEQYGAKAPLPHLQAHGVSVERPMSYRDFMESGSARDAFVLAFVSSPGVPREYEPGGALNWQAQHPPFYYMLLSPLVRATDGLAFATQMMALRIASWLMAVAGLAIGVWGTATYLRRCAPCDPLHTDHAGWDGALAPACLAYPFVVPMFFPEFARLGNDSLCLLLFGAVWAILLSTCDREPSLWRAASLGACLGAGLLAKAFFIPISLGVVGCLGWSAWRPNASGARRGPMLRDVAVVSAVAMLIGAWWYLRSYMQHGVLTGSNDLIALSRDGGLIAGLREHFEWRHMVRGIAAFIVTGYFAGTWTLARLPEWMYAPGLVAIGVLCFAALRPRPEPRARRLMNVMLWVLVPMLCGLAYHLLSRIAGGTGGHGTPGWYVSILAPACAVPLGAGMIAVSRWRRLPWLATAMWVWMVCFVVATFWLHAALYAGVAVKDMETRHLTCPDGWASLLNVAEIHNRLSVFGWPTASLICLGGGALLALLAASSLQRKSAVRT